MQTAVEKELIRIQAHCKSADLSLAKRYLELRATFFAICNVVTLLAGATTKLLPL